MLAYSPLESARFGLKVLRGTLAALDQDALLRDIFAQEADVAIVRLPAGYMEAAARLTGCGLPVLHADTLVYHGVDLDRIGPAPECVVDEATPADAKALGELVALAFADYRSHYRANPWFAPDAIRAGYEEWAIGYLSGRDAGRRTWVIRRDGALVAFATCHCDAASGIGEIVLNGVHPEHAGRGLYGHLVRHLQHEFKRMGLRRLIVSTQVWNHAVQKVWARNGLVLERTFDTWHINALLSAGESRMQRELRLPCTGNAAVMAEISSAMEAEFPRLRLLRTGTVFTRNAPAGMPCALQLRCLMPPRSATMHAVATVRDADGRVCVYSWNDLAMER